MTVRPVWRHFIPRPWYAAAIVCCCVLVLNLALGLTLGQDSLAATTATTAAPVAGSLASATAASDAALRERVTRDRWVKVKVDLVQPGTAGAPLDSALLQADLDQAAKDLLFALPAGSYDSLLHVPGSASLTLRVDAAGLDGVLASPLVAAASANADMQRIAAGACHSLAVRPDGSLWVWGSNAYGQLGDGTKTDHLIPVQVLTGGMAVAAGAYHTLAIQTDGVGWAWGLNDVGQLGNGTTRASSYQSQIWGSVSLPLAAVAAGSGHSLALGTNGNFMAWGDNWAGQLGDHTTTTRLNPVSGWFNAVAALSAGSWHTLALKTDGTLWASGFNWYGQVGDGKTSNRMDPVQVSTGVAAVAGGAFHTLAIKTDGSLWAWGTNSSGQIGDGTTTGRYSPVQVLTGVVAAAAGADHSLAIKSDGTLWTWGSNLSGQLGDGTITNRSSPVQVLTGVTAVTGGNKHSLVLKTDGSLWAWGANACGQLGDGTTTNRSIPVQISFTRTPDFEVTNVVLTPSDPAANGTFSAAVTVKNRGTAAGTPGTLQVWAHQSAAQSCGAVGDKSATLASLAPGASQTVTLNGLPAGAVGTKTLRAFVDSQCQNTETDETNNQSGWSYYVRPIVDFVVTNVVLTPSVPVANGGFSAAVTVKNQGTAGVGAPATLQVWADDEGAAKYCFATGNQSTTLTGLAAGASQTVTFSNLPAGAGGTKTLRAFIDSQCGSAETDETNNQYTSSYTVTAPPSDFVVTSVVVTPISPAANGTFSVAVTVKNQGTSAGAPGVLQVWTDQVAAQPCGTVGNRSATLPSLAAGASLTVTLSGLPSGAVGTKTLRAFVDSTCLTAEPNEANNQYATVYNVAAPGLTPDFAVTSVVLTPSSPKANATFSAAVTVTNQGAASGTGGWLDVWANQPTAQTCPANGNIWTSVGTLAAGASKTFTFSGLSAGVVGTKTLRAFVDSYCGAAESNEANNQTALSYSVIP